MPITLATLFPSLAPPAAPPVPPVPVKADAPFKALPARAKPYTVIDSFNGRVFQGGKQVWPSLNPVEDHRRAVAAAEAELERRNKALAPHPNVSPDDSGARQRLADAMHALAHHAVVIAAHREREAEARAPIERLTEAQARARSEIAAVEDAMSALNQVECKSIHDWAGSDTGADMPAPDASARVAIAQRLAQAKRKLHLIAAEMVDARAAMEPIGRENTVLGQQLANIVAAVLCEQAEIAGHRLNAAVAAVVNARVELRGINAALNGLRGATLMTSHGLVSPPAIGSVEEFFHEESLSVPGFRIVAHADGQDVAAVVAPLEIRKHASHWRAVALALLEMGNGNDGALAERAELLSENAALRETLAASGIAADPVAAIDGVST